MESPSPTPAVSPPPPTAGWAARLAGWRGGLSGRPGAAVLGAAGVLVAAAALFLLLSQPFGPAAPLSMPRAEGATGAPTTIGPAGAAAAAEAPAGGAGIVTVHAAGAVARPGIYAVPAGARVADVLAAAGGPVPEADVDRLNLAARVSDGERITVARQGDPPASATAPDGGSGPASAGAGAGAGDPATPPPLDLNAATAEQLDTLPGVGPATARSILSYRSRHGRFRSVTELLEVPGIGPAKMEALRPLVRV